MAPSMVAFVLFAIFHVSHGVENGNHDAPSPPSDKMKALSNLAATLHTGPADHSPLAITVYSKIAMVELQAYAATVVAQGDSVVKEDVRICGEFAQGFVGKIEKALGADLKLFKISPAQKIALHRAWAKMERTTPNHVQSLDKWCQGAKSVMDDLALEGYAQATGCILVIKDLVRKIWQLSTAHQDPPQKSEGTPVVVSRKLQGDPAPIEITSSITVSGDTATGSVYPSLQFECGYFNENAFLYSFEASSAMVLGLETVSGVVYAGVIDEEGSCERQCGSFESPCIFFTTAGQNYRILVYAPDFGGPAEFALTIVAEDFANPPPIQLEEIPATVDGNIDFPSGGGNGGIYTESFETYCSGIFIEGFGVKYTFVASGAITTAETCGSDVEDTVLLFFKDGSCIGGCDEDPCNYHEQCSVRTIPGETYSVLVSTYARGEVGPFTLSVTGTPGPELPAICSSPVIGNTAAGPSQRSLGLGLGSVNEDFEFECPISEFGIPDLHTSAFYTFQAAETTTTDVGIETSCEEVAEPVMTVYGADGSCLISARLLSCSGGGELVDLSEGETYFVGVSNYFEDDFGGGPFAFTLSISPEPICPPVTPPPETPTAPPPPEPTAPPVTPPPEPTAPPVTPPPETPTAPPPPEPTAPPVTPPPETPTAPPPPEPTAPPVIPPPETPTAPPPPEPTAPVTPPPETPTAPPPPEPTAPVTPPPETPTAPPPAPPVTPPPETPTAPPPPEPTAPPVTPPPETPTAPPPPEPTAPPVTPPPETPTEPPVTPPPETPTEPPVTPPPETPTAPPVTPAAGTPPSPPVSSPSWCEKITPLEYSLSGKGKKKAIKECLKYDLIGDSALPEEIGQIGLTSPGMLGLGGGVGLMALLAVLAVVLKRRVPAEPHWLPVPEVE